MKPTIDLKMRVSIDSSHKQRFTEEQILTEIENHNVSFTRNLICRKTDGAVLGEILTSNKIE